MIGFIQGKVLFSDGVESIILANSGVGHQVYYNNVLVEGETCEIFISHVIRENSEELYGFQSLREKKLFETLTKVKGVGPKSGYSLVQHIGVQNIIEAITFENKKILTTAPGIGAKAAAQIILDLKDKIQKVKMYSSVNKSEFTTKSNGEVDELIKHDNNLLEETIMACKELGFKEEKIIQVAHTIMLKNSITKSEQLVHLVLKEI